MKITLFKIPSLKTCIIAIIITYAITIYSKEVNIISIMAFFVNLLFTVLLGANIFIKINKYFNTKVKALDEKLKEKRKNLLWGENEWV